MFSMFNSFSNPWLKKAAYFFLGALLVAALMDAVTPRYGMYGAGYGVVPPGPMPVMGPSFGGYYSHHMGMHGQHMNGYAAPMYSNPYFRPY
ncbi:hypothetical protein [Sporomusa acidovorans]|uniref:hypothetical protein n=1 Tax=Sporomusa acidovorans TaxID=112900 RepID=UPI00088ACA86|nr:hypothetical protein [Sporomusa acidovorans]OZC19079.1 hypothetical protein SPACI_31650 [Sporomusa acidovorans DSM 3132]SDD66548.1 hypothetical protein SAMN04488499_100325 [Sporomusa acidovorans]